MKKRTMAVCQCLECGSILRSRSLSKKFNKCIFCSSTNLTDTNIKSVFIGLTETEKERGLHL